MYVGISTHLALKLSFFIIFFRGDWFFYLYEFSALNQKQKTNQ